MVIHNKLIVACIVSVYFTFASDFSLCLHELKSPWKKTHSANLSVRCIGALRGHYGSRLSALKRRSGGMICHPDDYHSSAAHVLTTVRQDNEAIPERTPRFVTGLAITLLQASIKGDRRTASELVEILNGTLFEIIYY